MNRFLIHVKIILLIRNKGEKHEKWLILLLSATLMLSACGKSDERASLEKDVKTTKENDDLKNQKKDLEKQKRNLTTNVKSFKKLMIQLRQNQLKMIQKAMKVIVVTQINHQIVIHTNNLRAKVPLKIARQVTKRILLRQMVVVIHSNLTNLVILKSVNQIAVKVLQVNKVAQTIHHQVAVNKFI